MEQVYVRPDCHLLELAMDRGLLAASTDPLPIVPVDPGFTDSQSWGDLNGE